MAVDIIAHQVGPMPCWSYVSRGLAAAGQREIVLTISAGPGEVRERPPVEPLSYYSTVFQLATRGSLVDEDGFTGFGGAGMLGAMGLAYGAAVPLDGVSVPSDALVAVLLTGPEARQANAIGTTRVLTRLGRAYRWYPHPFWSDRSRRSLVADDEGSLLDSVAVARVPGAFASLDGTIVTLRLPRSAAEVLAGLADVPPAAGVALTCGIDRGAAGHFVWQPGQKGPEAIQASPGPERGSIGGTFVLFVPEQEASSGQIFEDGFAFMLTDPDWLRLRKALMTGTRASIPAAPGALSLTLDWR